MRPSASPAAAPKTDPLVLRVEAAQQLLQRDRARGLAQLNDVFRQGTLPDWPLQGATHGQMIAVDLGPGLTPLVAALLAARMPWCGKTFDAAEGSGENLFHPGFIPVSRLFFGYSDFRPAADGRVVGMPFRTYAGQGLKDPDRRVLKIDYGVAANPRLTIRPILDELVQIAGNYYLGKAYYRLSTTRARLVFYFALQRQ